MVVVSYGCGIYRVVKFMRAEHISVVLCSIAESISDTCAIIMSVCWGPRDAGDLLANVESCMEELCTVNTNRDAFHLLLVTRGESLGSGRDRIRLNPELHPFKVLVAFLDFPYLVSCPHSCCCQ